MIAKENLGIGSQETAEAPAIPDWHHELVSAVMFLFPEPRRWVHSLQALSTRASMDESRAAATRVQNCIHAWEHLASLVEQAQSRGTSVLVVTQHMLAADPLSTVNWMLKQLGLDGLGELMDRWSFPLDNHPRIVLGHPVANDGTFYSNVRSDGPRFASPEPMDWPEDLAKSDAVELDRRYQAICEATEPATSRPPP